MSAVMVDLPEPMARDGAPPAPRLDFWTAGVDEFVHHLKEPETLFNVPSPRLASSRYPAIGPHTTKELKRYFRRYQRRCMDAYATLLYAGGLMQRRGVQICSGPLEVRIWYDDCDDCYVDVIVSVDATPERAAALNDEMYGCPVGYFDITFESVDAPRPARFHGRLLAELFDDLDDEPGASFDDA